MGDNDLDGLLSGWDGELLAVRREVSSGSDTTMIVCVHSLVDGRSGGGCRMAVYPSVADAIRDGQRLSTAMTLKFAVNALPLGGGKSVLAVRELPTGKRRRELLHAFGSFLETLGGIYGAGPDMNTSDKDMDIIGEMTPHVYCRTTSSNGTGDTAFDTTTGVFHGIVATVHHVLGTSLNGCRIVVQGLGGVGAPLAERLLAAGADVRGTDVSADKLTALAERGVVPLAPQDALDTECDVLVPCAVGGVLNANTIPRLRCRIVAGAANNQLAEPTDAERLRQRGIVYAPDFVINSGGVLHGMGFDALGWSRAELDQRLAGIGDTLIRIYAEAGQANCTTEAAARRLAEEMRDRMIANSGACASDARRPRRRAISSSLTG